MDKRKINAVLLDIKKVLEKHSVEIWSDGDASDDTNLQSWLEVVHIGELDNRKCYQVLCKSDDLSPFEIDRNTYTEKELEEFDDEQWEQQIDKEWEESKTLYPQMCLIDERPQCKWVMVGTKTDQVQKNVYYQAFIDHNGDKTIIRKKVTHSETLADIVHVWNHKSDSLYTLDLDDAIQWLEKK